MSEYVLIDAKPQSSQPEHVGPTLSVPEPVAPEPVGPKPKRKYTKRSVKPNDTESQDALRVENDETKRKRDILASVALRESVKDYIVEDIPAIQFRTMKRERLEPLFELYQQKAGQELAIDGMSSLIGIGMKALNYLSVELNNEDRLREELLDNRFLKRTIGSQASKIAEEYDDFVGIFRAVITVFNHLSLEDANKDANGSGSDIKKDLEPKT